MGIELAKVEDGVVGSDWPKTVGVGGYWHWKLYVGKVKCREAKRKTS